MYVLELYQLFPILQATNFAGLHIGRTYVGIYKKKPRHRNVGGCAEPIPLSGVLVLRALVRRGRIARVGVFGGD